MSPAPRRLTADRGDAGRRLDLVLRRHLADLASATRTRVQRWIDAGQVTVNGAAVRRVAAPVAAGDVLSVALPDDAPRAATPAEDVPLHVLYEDEHLLAVDKPAGVVVHPTYGHQAGTMLNALVWHARDWPDLQRPSIVGRLDKDTSGVVVVAKTRGVHAALQRVLSSTHSAKEYLAVVYGRVNAARGDIALRLERDRRDRRRVVASASHGAPSLTRFERISRVAAPLAGLSLLRCSLVTGRMHQIRVHLAARGWPLVGDPKYGEPRWKEVVDPLLAATLQAFPRQALHAWRVAFVHPVTRASLLFEAPIPSELNDLLDASGLPTKIPQSRSNLREAV
jgi:23S rRNA pseudouridine1911/1915/1917 synthase